MAVTVHTIPAFTDNYIWALQGDADDLWLVDPGDEHAARQWLVDAPGRLAGLLITHHHWDHVGAVDALLAAHDVPVYGPADSPCGAINHPLRDGDTVRAAGLDFTVMAVPGHTLDHIAYYAEPADDAPILFCGDTLFAGGCGRLFEGTPEQMLASLERLAALPGDTRVYCAHEYTQANLRFARACDGDNPTLQERTAAVDRARADDRPTVPSTLAEERATNPFLRAAEPALRHSASEHAQRELHDPLAVFSELRAWKDSF